MARLREVWRTWWGKLAIIAGVVVVLGVTASFIAAKATESNRFCGRDCHEMLPYDATWETSKHREVDCVTCHIPPGAWNFVKTKFFALREVWVHLTGGVKAPIQVTRQIPNVVCTDCHPSAETAKPIQLVTTTFSHRGHESVSRCVVCHSQVVHHPIAGVAYIPPRSMTACFTCHNDGQQPNACDYCHTAPHPDRGACSDCHGLQTWSPEGFKHPVPLVGPHARALCEDCHTSGAGAKIGAPDGCVDCHGNHHRDARLTMCADCHTVTSFQPSTFTHPQVGPHVPAGEVPLACNACHRATFAEATCSCHGITTPITPGQPIPVGD